MFKLLSDIEPMWGNVSKTILATRAPIWPTADEPRMRGEDALSQPTKSQSVWSRSPGKDR
jgi:hypothetical protein